MARSKGIAPFSANFEPQVASPLDARDICPTKAELVLPETWAANDGGIYAYKGMRVSVTDDGANNGVYRLNDTDYTNTNNWVLLGSGTGGSGDVRDGDYIWPDQASADAYFDANASLKVDNASRLVALPNFNSTYLAIGIP